MTPALTPAMDAGIPVLTEVLEAAPAAPAPAAPVPAAHAPAADGPDWAALERKVAERVLTGLADRVDFVLDARIHDALLEVLDSALRGLTAELRKGLHQTLDEVVARAVAQEIARLRAHP